MSESAFDRMRSQIRKSVKASKGNLKSTRFDTSDVIQEAMVQIWNDICNSRLRDEILSETFLNRIGRGHMAKMRRYHTAQKRTVQKEELVPSENQLANNAQNPDEQIANVEQIERLRDAIKESLTPVQKYIVYRRFFEDALFAEIGVDINKSSQWVRREYLKAISQLKTVLGASQAGQ